MSDSCLHRLYYNINMYINYINLREMLSESCKYDINKTINIIFYIRDCRNGRGLREIGKLCYQWLLFNYPDQLKEVLHYIPNVGRWDDLYSVFPRRTYEINKSWIIENNLEIPTNEKILKIIECQQTAVQIYIERLKDDLKNIEKNRPTSLASKWAVTEKSSLNRKYKFVNVICNQWGINKKTYRQIISKIRNTKYSIEKILTTCNYKNIKFSKIPKLALIKYRNILYEKQQNNFMIYLTFLKLKSDMFKPPDYSPIDLVLQYNKISGNNLENEVSDSVEKEWENIVLRSQFMGKFKDCLSILDNTGSMYQQDVGSIKIYNKMPINIGIAISVLISRCCNKPFNNIVMTYSDDCNYIYLRKDETLHESMEQILNYPSTNLLNLEKILEKILETTNFNNKSGMIKNIIIFSDKSFINSVNNYKEIIQKVYNQKYSIYGYKIPNILYFNINTNDINIIDYESDYNTITEVTGFSHEIINNFINTGSMDVKNQINLKTSKYFSTC